MKLDNKVTINLSAKTVSALKKLAKKNKLSLSETIRAIIIAQVK